MSNLALAFKQYQWHLNSRSRAKIKTAFIRYTLPGLGFVIPERSSERLNSHDIKLAIEYAEQFPLDEDIGNKLLKVQEETLLSANVTYENRRQQKTILNKFIDYIRTIKKNLNLPVKIKKQKYEYVRKFVADYSHVENNKKKRKKKYTIQLSLDPKKYPGDFEGNRRELKRIEGELSEFADFLPNIQSSKTSRTNTLRVTKRLLGWLYRKTQSLTEVSLRKLIPVVDIYPAFKNFCSHNDYFIARYQQEEEAKQSAKGVVKFVKDFFTDYEVPERGAKLRYIDVVVNIAKFNYKSITDPEEYDNYSDISVVRRLRILKNQIPKDDPEIAPWLPDWEVIMRCLHEIKRRADLICDQNGTPRTEEVRDRALQRFLILGMFTLVPPSRQRVIRELRIGETLKHGLFKDGVFIPKDELENPEEAKYFIHLQPEDYKTGKTYGEWLAEFPDRDLKDGTTFYQYLDKWVYGGARDRLLNGQAHNYLFLQSEIGLPMTVNNMTSVVSRMFDSTLKMEITPHDLRTIFRTHLADKGASQQELDSAAFWMRHDPKTGRKEYTKQTLENKLRPGEEVAGRFSDRYLKKINNEHLKAV